MTYGIRKGLEDVAYELKGIRNILASLWAQKEENGGVGTTNPELYADEYISTEECARRLSVTDQTIRNWIAKGRKTNAKQGWIEGVHYVNVNPGVGSKGALRIPWNQLVRSFKKNPAYKTSDFVHKDNGSYRVHPESIDAYLSNLNANKVEEDSDGTSI